MPTSPVSDEVGAALGRFFTGGSGPSHSTLTAIFASAGYGEYDHYDPQTTTPNKETRVQQVFRGATRRPDRGRELVEGLLGRLRVAGCFEPDRDDCREAVRATQRALGRLGWVLDDDGVLRTAGDIDLSTGGREALDEQLARLRRARPLDRRAGSARRAVGQAAAGK